MADPAWFQDLIPASFRGVPFFILSHELKGGRLGPDHQFPDSDIGDPEDTGGMLERYPVDAYIIGDTFHIEADALIQALRIQGPGILNHPRYGERRTQVRTWSRKEDNAEGGIARITIDFRDAPDGGLTIAVFSDLETTADETVAAVSATFEVTFNATGVSGAVGDAALASTDALFADVTKALRRNLVAAGDALEALAVAPSTATLIADPALLASTLAGVWLVAPLASLRAFTALRALVQTTTGTDPNEALILTNNNALAALGQRLALAEYARQAVPLIEDTFAVFDDAIAIRDELTERLRVEETTTDSTEYDTLITLRTDAYKRISDAAEPLARLRTIVIQHLTNALVLAWELYEDAARAVEIIDRNALRHGGFIAAGTELSVLAE